MNKKVLILVIALAVVTAGAVVYFKFADRSDSGSDNLLVPTAAADVYEDDNRLEIIQGTASVTRVSGEVEEISDETTVDMGDSIKISENGKATLYWFDHSISRLAAGTELKIDQAAYNPENINEADIGFEVISGEVWSKVQAIVDEDSEFLSYTGSVVAGVRGSVFNFKVDGDEVVVDSIAHALQVGDETLTSGEQAGFKKDDGEETFKHEIPIDQWDRQWFRENAEFDKADRERMMAAMMNRLRNSIGALPGEPKFMDKIAELDEFMRSDATQDEKDAVKAKIVALIRAMDILPDDKDFSVKEMLQKKLLDWEDDEAHRRFLMEKQIERRLFALYDWLKVNDPSPAELRAYLTKFRDLVGRENEFFHQHPELIGLVEKIIGMLEDKMPELMENAEFLRAIDRINGGKEPTFDPPVERSAPVWNVEPAEDSIKLLDVEPEPQDPPITKEPPEVIEEEAPFHRGESNV